MVYDVTNFSARIVGTNPTWKDYLRDLQMILLSLEDRLCPIIVFDNYICKVLRGRGFDTWYIWVLLTLVLCIFICR